MSEKRTEADAVRSVAKGVLWFGGSIAATVVGGLVLEHVVRKMDKGLFHLPGTDLYWRPGGDPTPFTAERPNLTELRPVRPSTPPPGEEMGTVAALLKRY